MRTASILAAFLQQHSHKFAHAVSYEAHAERHHHQPRRTERIYQYHQSEQSGQQGGQNKQTSPGISAAKRGHCQRQFAHAVNKQHTAQRQGKDGKYTLRANQRKKCKAARDNCQKEVPGQADPGPAPLYISKQVDEPVYQRAYGKRRNEHITDRDRIQNQNDTGHYAECRRPQ